MQSSLEKVGAIGRKLNVVVPATEVEEAIQKRLKQLAKRVKVRGFRPGKVPMKIVDQQYRGAATSDVLPDIINNSLQSALKKEEVVPAVQPDIDPQPLEKGADFSYAAIFDVYPQFQKLDLKGVSVKKPESEIAEEDVDQVIENMRKQQLEWEDVTRKAKMDDRVTIDFKGTVDGEEFEGNSTQDFPLVLGGGQMLPDFEEGIVGMKAGDSKEVKVVFPEDYSEDLGGKTAVFRIDAKSVSVSKLPELDEAFAKDFGIESGAIDELRAEVKSNMQTNLEVQLSEKVRQRAFDALLEQNETEIPLKMVQEEAERMVQEQKNQMMLQGIDAKLLENLPKPDFEILKPQAERRVALALLMMEVIKKNDLKPDEARVTTRIEKMASSYEDPQEFIDYYKANQQALTQVQSIVLEEQVVDLLLEEADVEIETLSASELLNMQSSTMSLASK